MMYEQFIKDHYLVAVDLLMQLGKIPSPSHKEDKRAAFLYDWFVSHKASDVHIDEAKNVICKIQGKKEDAVIFMAHTDVVFEDETELPMELDGDILRCPGIGDDTANLINLLMCYLYIQENHITPEYTLYLIANCCEEGLGNLDGTKQIMHDYQDQIAYFYTKARVPCINHALLVHWFMQG